MFIRNGVIPTETVKALSTFPFVDGITIVRSDTRFDLVRQYIQQTLGDEYSSTPTRDVVIVRTRNNSSNYVGFWKYETCWRGIVPDNYRHCCCTVCFSRDGNLKIELPRFPPKTLHFMHYYLFDTDRQIHRETFKLPRNGHHILIKLHFARINTGYRLAFHNFHVFFDKSISVSAWVSKNDSLLTFIISFFLEIFNFMNTIHWGIPLILVPMFFITTTIYSIHHIGSLVPRIKIPNKFRSPRTLFKNKSL